MNIDIPAPFEVKLVLCKPELSSVSYCDTFVLINLRGNWSAAINTSLTIAYFKFDNFSEKLKKENYSYLIYCRGF